MRLLKLCGVVALSALACLPDGVLASVLAIDYGSDFITASLMKPGLPFDVLLNKDSKRKIASVVAWKKGDRLFGQDAANLATRFPTDTFSHLKLLQAAPFESPIVDYFKQICSAKLVPTDRKTIAAVQPDGKEWLVEELLAMQFAYVKHLAEELAGEKVTNVVVAVPPYFSQFERDAIADAIEISGLKTLALINDGTASAVNYAMTRTFPTPEYHIVYDAGSSGIRATIASFTTVPDTKSAGGTATHIAVAGVAYERNIGGTELDKRLREVLIKAFNKKAGKDVRTDKRGMAKLWKEAQRVKAILSANTEAIASVESVAWDVDFKVKVTRAEFEEACEDLKSHFAVPILDALKNAGLTMDNITSIILTGGVTRTPMVQTALKAAVGEDKLAPNVNADESVVLGTALYGASLSRQFKTKSIKVSDIGVHDIQVSYFAASATPNTRPRSITSNVFPAGSKTGTKKVLTFKRKEDFTLHFDYKHEIAPGFPTRMMEVDLGNVTEAIANLTERGAVDPVVKATVMLSESGFVSVTDAVAYGEIKDDSLTENVPPRDGDSTSTDSASASPSPSAAAEKKEKKEPVENTIALTIETRWTTIPPMTVEQKKKSRSKLRAADQEEAAKNRREEARNTFEGYLYRLRDLLNEDDNETPFKKCSKDEERKAITEKLEESFQWLYDRGELAETSQFLDKRIALETMERPIIHRYQEIEAFPQALNNSQKWNWSTRLFLTEARANLTAEIAADLPSKWTSDELDSLEKTLKEHEAWLVEWVEKQKDVKPNEDPVIQTTEMKARAKVLEGQLHRLWKRKVPKAVKKPKVTPTAAAEEPVKTDDADSQKKDKEPAAEEGQNAPPEPEPASGGDVPKHDEL